VVLNPRSEFGVASDASDPEKVMEVKIGSNAHPAFDLEGLRREAKRKYLHQYLLNRYERASTEELPQFVADPLREQELGLVDVIVCRLCGLKLKKLPQHLFAKHLADLSEGNYAATTNDLAMNYRKRFGYNKRAPLMSKELVDTFALLQRQRNSRRRHKGKPAIGRATRFRRGAVQKNTIVAATQARKEWGMSTQTRRQRSTSNAGIAIPARWKKIGQDIIATDWLIAQLRLKGREHQSIAQKVGLTRPSVSTRLKRMHFPPGKPCCFFRGSAITEKRLQSHFEDLKELEFRRVLRKLGLAAKMEDPESGSKLLLIEDLAALLKVNVSWIRDRVRTRSKDQIPHSRVGKRLMFSLNDFMEFAKKRHDGRTKLFGTSKVEQDLASSLGTTLHRVYEFLVHPGGPQSRRDPKASRRPNHPLSIHMADRLLASEAALRREFGRIGSSAKGGRPKALLPSEQKELPEKYHALMQDLELLLHWAALQTEPITANEIGNWMCDMTRRGQLRMLLFWPSVHDQLLKMCERARDRQHGGSLGSAERAKEILCQEYQISMRHLSLILNRAV
jgi:Helix-turn-helix domain